MSAGKVMLSIGAAVNFGIAALHVALGFADEKTERFFGAPPWVVRWVHEERVLLVLLCLAMAAVFSLFAIYALSGAGRMRRLPGLRAGLVAIGSIYVLRGLTAIGDLRRLTGAPHPGGAHFLVFSLVALVTGLLYIAGALADRKRPTAGARP